MWEEELLRWCLMKRGEERRRKGGAYEVTEEEIRKGREVAGQYYRLGTG